MNSNILHLPALHSRVPCSRQHSCLCVGLHRHMGPRWAFHSSCVQQAQGTYLVLCWNLARCVPQSWLLHLEGITKNLLNFYPGSWKFPICSHWLPRVMLVSARFGSSFLRRPAPSIPQGDISRLPLILTSRIFQPSADFLLWRLPSC